ncbi:MAG: hypothetical protein EOP10_00480 [Proteobacteria bacterium]|nr:MAG: hypothetical protein EOP10_00480 [Pseudomonadota bacterium]
MTFRKALLGLLCLGAALGSELRADEKAENCRKLYEGTLQHYKALAKFLPRNFVLHDQLPTHQFLKPHGDDCEISETSDVFQKVLSLHSQKIAVMLPLGRWAPLTQKSMINQVRAYFAQQGLDPQKQLVILDTQGQPQIMQQQLAQLVFTQHISVIVGGLTIAEAPVLTKWATQLRIPTIILNRKLEPPRNRFVFRVGPDQRELAQSLLAYTEGRGFKRVAVMMPQSSRDGVFVDALRANGKTEIIGPLVYNPFDYTSIDMAFKRLFHLNDDARKQELLDLVTEFKDKSKEEGVAFDPKGLMLPPQVDFDALLIVDHFKNVRHLAKSLHYYGVRGLPLLGIPKWRAPEIVEQDEENLRGAVFVDYVGSYNRLPYGITAPNVYDENFIEGASASRVDLELVVTHALSAAVKAIQGPRVARYSLYKRIEAAMPENKAFFGQGSSFRTDHEGNWPTFLFSLQKGKLAAIGQNLGRRKPPVVTSKPL